MQILGGRARRQPPIQRYGSMTRLLCIALLLCPLAVLACTPEGEFELRLEREPAEFVGARPEQRVQRVALYPNGCLVLQRPAYFRDPGRFTLPVSAATLANLRAQAKALQAKGSLQQRVGGELDRATQAKSLAGEVMVQVADADRVRLWLGGGSKAPALQIEGLQQKAEALPDAAALNASALLVQELLREAERPGRVPMTEDAL
jgi:hypothetical protein